MTITLRDYQIEAVDSVLSYWSRGGPGSPLVEVPTGGGKSAIIGELCRRLAVDYSARVVVATHRAELIQQDAKAIRMAWGNALAPVAIYSAGLGQRQVNQVTVCGVQSVYRNASHLGRVDVMLVDEAHLVNPAEGTQYARLIESLHAVSEDMRCVGLTATPYRMGQGLLTHGEDAIFDCITYRVDVRSLVDRGYLSPLVSQETHSLDLSEVKTAAGDYVMADLELASNVDAITQDVAQDIAAAMTVVDLLSPRRRAALVFGCTLAHCHKLADAINARGVRAIVVTKDTDKRERAKVLEDCKAGRLPCIVSCDVLTTGFDAPIVDIVALVRPTQSPGLYVQMAGRGTRLHEGKRNCLLLDYGGNIARHGPITDIKTPQQPQRKGKGEAPTKTCPTCQAEVHASARVCEHCDFEFPAPERKANAKASTLSPMERAAKRETHAVSYAEVHPHKGKSGVETVRVDYWDDGQGRIPKKIISEYVCIGHEGFARKKAEDWWWRMVGTQPPAPVNLDDPESMRTDIDVVKEAIARLDDEMKAVTSISIEPEGDGKYMRVVDAVTTKRDPSEWSDAKMQRERDGFLETADDVDSVFGDDFLPF